MLIIEEWIQDWLERDKDSRWMSEEQFAKHEIEKKMYSFCLTKTKFKIHID